MASFREVITEIVQEQEESMEDDFSSDVESDEQAVESLNIERRGDELIVCQYTTQRGDLMRDPEVRFEIDGFWKPVEYRNDYLNKDHGDGNGLSVNEFLRDWATNLEHHFL